MILPPAIPTYQVPASGIWTRPDNVFLSEEATHALVSCDVTPEEMVNGADHIPIATVLNLRLLQSEPPRRRNFRLTEWETFSEKLAKGLEDMPTTQEITSSLQLNKAVGDITKTIQKAIEAAVPISKPCPFSKKWWTSKLSVMKKKINRLSARAYKFRAVTDHDVHTELRKERAIY
ncbi:hypothetical protein DFH05DRAFT_1366758, partial [Lentinula detonsa]